MRLFQRFPVTSFKHVGSLTAWLLLLGLVAVATAGGRFPWPRRIGRNVDSLHITAHKNTPIDIWPEEPRVPSSVDEKRFVEAIGELCREVTVDRKEFRLGTDREDPAEPLSPVLVNPYLNRKKTRRPRSAVASEAP